MMKKILIGCAVLAFAIACNKKEIKTTSVEKNDVENNRGRGDVIDLGDPDYEIDLYGDHFASKTDAFAELYKNYTSEKTQQIPINAEEGATIIGEHGTIVVIGANNFTNYRGVAVTGEVQIELIEVFNRAEMVLLDKATSGISEDGESVVTLVSGGEIFLRATQDGREVNLIDPITVIVEDAGADSEMLKFVDAGVDGDDFLWEVEEGEEMAAENIEIGGGKGDGGGGGRTVFGYKYTITPAGWGWTNIDKWYNNPCAKTTLFVEVPTGHDNTNTEVYLSYDGDENMLANFDTWTGTKFTEHYGQICIGLDCHFIAVSNASGSLEYAIQAATIVNGHVEVISSFTPITIEDLIIEINGLP